MKKGKGKDQKQDEKSFVISSAIIKDDFCNYSFIIKKGVGSGDEHNVKGSSVIHEDLASAMARFNVHLACIDEVFKHSGIEFENIDSMISDELTQLYHVTGFKISGGENDESIILIGSKHVSSVGGRIGLTTPKIPLDNLSSYQWYNELKDAADAIRNEVALYKEGKCTFIETEEQQPDPKQLKIGVDLEEGKM